MNGTYTKCTGPSGRLNTILLLWMAYMAIIALLFATCNGALAQNPYVTPEQYGAIGKAKTCAQMGWDQAKVDRKFKDVGATPAWSVDRAAWQAALNAASKNKKIIMPTLPVYYFDDMVRYDYNTTSVTDINYCEVYIIANKNLIRAMPGSTKQFAFFGRAIRPTTRAEATTMFVKTRFRVDGLKIQGNGPNTQTGLDLNSVGFIQVEYCEINDVRICVKADFCMWGGIRHNNFGQCRTCVRSGLAIAGDTEMSSNQLEVMQNECHTASDTAYINLHGYEQTWNNNTIEGNGNTIVGAYFDMGNKTTGKNFDMGTWHLEQGGTASTAWFKLKMREQVVRLRVPNVHDATNGLLIDAESSVNGIVILEWLTWFDEPKYFKTDGKTTWKFHYCRALGNTVPTSVWQGIIPQKGKQTDVGINSYEVPLGF